MTKKELSQLYYLNREITADKQKLSELESFSKGTTLKITGLPHINSISNKTAIAAEIADIENEIEAKVSLSIIEYNRLNRYIATINDTLIRQIISLRFINGLTWRNIAQHIGGGNTESSVRKTMERFFDKNN